VGADYGARFGSFAAEWPRLRQLVTSGADGDTRLTPWTVDRGPAVLMAAWRGPLVTRAAQDADGWIASAAYNDDATLAAALGRFRDAGGRRAVVTNIQVAADIEPTLARLRAFREMGFDDAVVFDLRPAPERWQTIYDAAS
jgi:hypothetical protein